MNIHRKFIPLLITIAALAQPCLGEIASFSSKHFAQRRPPFELTIQNTKEHSAALKDHMAKLQQAFELLSEGKRDDAAKIFSWAISNINKKTNSAQRGLRDEWLYLLGLAYEASNKDKEAEAAFTKSLSLRADNGPALLHLGVLLSQQRRCEEALARLDEAKWRLPEFEYLIMFEMSECDRHEGRTQVANQNLQRSLQLQPNYLPALRRAVELRLLARSKTPDPEKKAKLETSIIGDLRSIVAGDPDDYDAASILAQMLIETSDPFLDSGSLAEAEILMSKIVQDSDFKNPDNVYSLFESQLKQKKLSEAKTTIQQGLQKNPKNPKLQNASLQLEIEFGAQLVEK